MLLVIPVVLLFGPLRQHWRIPLQFGDAYLVNRTYALPADRADSMFQLLSPKDVRMHVARRRNGIAVAGTRQEIQVLDRFMSLVSPSPHNRRTQAPEPRLRHGVSASTCVRYQLPGPVAGALYQTLSWDEVPVMVSLEPGSVCVVAGPREQRIVEAFLKVLKTEEAR